MLKAHAMPSEQAFACEAIMTLANKVENQEKAIKELKETVSALQKQTDRNSGDLGPYRRIG